MRCKSGRHEWLDAVSADRCCNGWHRELRVPSPGRPACEPDDDPAGRVYLSDEELAGCVFVWVKDQQPEPVGD